MLFICSALSGIFTLSLSGAPPALRAAAARGGGDEAGPHRAGLGPVPQDLHPEARERQVSRNTSAW